MFEKVSDSTDRMRIDSTASRWFLLQEH